ncbi:MAG: aminotransferase class I/II-fold pyridoxal phosphate-dependent enzyme [Methylobacter sp.]|uniref:aminotransferase class I/II-fold pyridoxal phosphate-dependent enzyme n=1 Tax=Methylobacter sp. TaxID=2051955 RepID=UPI00272F9FE3|nr:aminotransferase class I/II-fold pyridoxal phosphate-dependent enzyme [Methylobacter sp.]MDP1665235.1 aminotransferase class I/II-fold pyridoxal phosphate-dependent enzyme [Methylobacter sp.]
MEIQSNWLTSIDRIVDMGLSHGLAQRTTEDEAFNGRTICLNGRHVLNFALCSYLGLEQDFRLKRGTIDAVTRYGTQFAISRAYMSATPYMELEAQLEELFGGHVLATPTTTLGHIAALPVLIQKGDAIIIDQMAHNSMQTAAKLLQAEGVPVETLLHCNLELLEERIIALGKRYRHIWYLTDGIYSMFGDLAPVKELGTLLNRYEQLHLYFDDAHGMSWIGKHGRGYVLDCLPIQERMVVATSLCKAYAAGGGALIFPNAQMHRHVKNCGGPMIFSGPIQPPMLGAALASARIHLSPEIDCLQQELQDRIALCNRLLQVYEIPVGCSSQSPIFYIKLGLPDIAGDMVKSLLDEGFYTNHAVYPAVSRRKSGIRFTLTRHLSFEDIHGLIAAIARNLPKVLETGPGKKMEKCIPL